LDQITTTSTCAIEIVFSNSYLRNGSVWTRSVSGQIPLPVSFHFRSAI